MPGPTDQEQLFLELINEARIDPMRNAARYISSYAPLVSDNPEIQSALDYFNVDGAALLAAYQALTAAAPLAWNASLATAAEKHSVKMITADEQSHQVAGEASLGDRVKAEGYNYTRLGENVYAYAEDVMYGHAGFMVDWGAGPGGMQSPAGHRNNIMWADFSEVGIDVTAESNSSTQVGPSVVTQDFGDRGLMFITGVAYSDNDGDEFYSLGEGRGDLHIQMGATSLTSATSGGYSLAATAGLKTLTLTGGGLASAVTVKTTIQFDSLKLDVVDGNTLLTTGSIEVEGSISVIRAIGRLSWGMTISAGAGDQHIIGYVGRDTLNGGAGNDVLEGNDHRDTLNGGEGNDELNGGADNDTLDGGSGKDVAVYGGASSQYTVRAQDDGSFVVSGPDSGTDTVSNVEVFRFANGDFVWNATQGKLTIETNAAPTVAASQSVSTNEDSSKQVTVTASDSNGDALTYTAGGPAHGSVTGGAGGVFTYTPTANYNGSDSFIVTVTDGKGGTATQTVNVSVAAQNDAPTVAESQNVTTTAGTAKPVSVTGSDIDGNPLSYTAAGGAHGTVTGGVGGQFLYTPNSGYSGNDSFTVTVNDGNGGTATHAVNITITGTPNQPSPSGNDFRLFAPDGYGGEVGGGGTVFGTNGFQEITLIDRPGAVRFDASFNRGGDIIRLPGNAADYTISRTGSSAVLADSDTTYTIPVGTTGTQIAFEDGVRTLVYDDVSKIVTLGDQIIANGLAWITAPSDDSPLPSGRNPDAVARSFLAGGGEMSVGGDQNVYGTTGTEELTYLYGDLVLDPSFNKGGDTLHLTDSPSGYSAYVSGSSVVILTEDGKITIPVGTVGMILDFDGEARVLRIDSASSSIKIGDLAITGTNAGNAIPLDSIPVGSGNSMSLDVGNGNTVAPVNLQANVSYLLTDNAGKESNVAIKGFDDNDLIRVTGAESGDYNFGTSGDDPNDLFITYHDPSGANNTIVIDDVLNGTVLVSTYESAVDAVGFNFMSFA